MATLTPELSCRVCHWGLLRTAAPTHSWTCYRHSLLESCNSTDGNYFDNYSRRILSPWASFCWLQTVGEGLYCNYLLLNWLPQFLRQYRVNPCWSRLFEFDWCHRTLRSRSLAWSKVRHYNRRLHWWALCRGLSHREGCLHLLLQGRCRFYSSFTSCFQGCTPSSLLSWCLLDPSPVLDLRLSSWVGLQAQARRSIPRSPLCRRSIFWTW